MRNTGERWTVYDKRIIRIDESRFDDDDGSIVLITRYTDLVTGETSKANLRVLADDVLLWNELMNSLIGRLP